MPPTPIIPLQDFHAQYESIRSDIALALAEVLERQDFVLGREVSQLEQEMARLCSAAPGAPAHPAPAAAGTPEPALERPRLRAIACGSGSDALLLALMALDVGAGGEVIVPAFTFFATAGTVARLGARPVFVDIDPRTFNISPDSAARAAAQHPKVKGAIPVDLFGQVADFEALAAATERRHPATDHGPRTTDHGPRTTDHGPRTFLIEDAAQAILAERDGRRAGSFGRIGCFSFYPTKNLGAYGEAGMLTTADDALADRLLRLRVHGGRDRYFHDEVGINSRLDTLQAAVLLVKLRRLEAWTAAREKAAARYDQMFADLALSCPANVYPTEPHPIVVPFVAPPPPPVASESGSDLKKGGRNRSLSQAAKSAARSGRGSVGGPPSLVTRHPGTALPLARHSLLVTRHSGIRHVYHQYTIRALHRDALRAFLDAEGIRTAIFYPLPLHLQKCFASLGGKEGDCPEAERAAREVLSLPIFPEITPAQQQRVVETIARFYKKFW